MKWRSYSTETICRCSGNVKSHLLYAPGMTFCPLRDKGWMEGKNNRELKRRSLLKPSPVNARYIASAQLSQHQVLKCLQGFANIHTCHLCNWLLLSTPCEVGLPVAKPCWSTLHSASIPFLPNYLTLIVCHLIAGAFILLQRKGN